MNEKCIEGIKESLSFKDKPFSPIREDYEVSTDLDNSNPILIGLTCRENTKTLYASRKLIQYVLEKKPDPNTYNLLMGILPLVVNSETHIPEY